MSVAEAYELIPSAARLPLILVPIQLVSHEASHDITFISSCEIRLLSGLIHGIEVSVMGRGTTDYLNASNKRREHTYL